MMQEVEVLKTIQELICSFFSEEQFTLSYHKKHLDRERIRIYNSITFNKMTRSALKGSNFNVSSTISVLRTW